MHPRLVERLDRARARADEIAGELSRPPQSASDAARQNKMRRELGELSPLVEKYREFSRVHEEIKKLDAMRGDAELADLIGEEEQTLRAAAAKIEEDLIGELLSSDAIDGRCAFVEIRAAVGGGESCLFAADLLRMYLRYAERRGWSAEIAAQAPGEVGGCREAVIRISAPGAYGRLKFESGAHRVQRVPATESQGRIHTSVCTVAVLPEAQSADVQIRPQDLRIDTFRSSGAGGQHVNTTDSAVRAVHLPTGISAECQDDRSQHRNRERALAILRARLLEFERDKQNTAEREERRRLVGSGDRSDRIRTYNFPQNRVTDHRVGLSLYKIAEVMEGDLDEIMDALAREERLRKMSELGGEEKPPAAE
jgi:peptide chain release factor 1